VLTPGNPRCFVVFQGVIYGVGLRRIVPPQSVSPKARSDLILTHGEELKLVYLQEGSMPEQYEDLAFRYHYLQPIYGPHLTQNTMRQLLIALEIRSGA